MHSGFQGQLHYEGGSYQAGYQGGAQRGSYGQAENWSRSNSGNYSGQRGNTEGYSGGSGWSGTEYDYQDRGRSYGAQGSGSGQQRHYDPDYAQWRNQQLRELDRDYDTWRQERYKKFSDDFTSWRSNRASTTNRASTDDTDVDSGLSASQASGGTGQSGKESKTK